MDKKQVIIAIVLSALVFVIWYPVDRWYQRTHPQAIVPVDGPIGPQTAPSTTQSASTQPTTESTVGISAHPPEGPEAVASTQPSTGDAILGSAEKDDPTYAMQLHLTGSGAAIEDITLNQFNAPKKESDSPKTQTPYQFQQPLPDIPGTESLATQKFIIDGAPVNMAGVRWKLIDSTASSATFAIDIQDVNQKRIVTITKTYRLDKRPDTQTTSEGYEVTINQTIKNYSGRKIAVQTVMNGPSELPAETESGNDRVVVIGYAKPKNDITVTMHPFSDIKSDADKNQLALTEDSDKQHFVWLGQASSYFGAMVLPGDFDQPQFTAHAKALVDPDHPGDRRVTISLESPTVSIDPDKESSLLITAYFGPKWRKVLTNSYYVAWPRHYDGFLGSGSSWCSTHCTVQWLIDGLVSILRFFHYLLRDWGLAIICLVLMVRTLLHPITKASQVRMMKMSKMSPEMEKLKKKYADQPDVLNKEMMKLYKEQSGAILGCLPMFLQTPIWIALWSALQTTFELRQAPFLYGFTWIHDLAKPDALVDLTRLFHGPITLPIVEWHIYSINILPLAMSVVTFINMKYFTPMPPAATPEQEQQQKLQRGMSAFFPLMFYSFPSGLNLYYLTTTTVGIIESKIVRNHIKQQEEAEKAGRVFVPTKPTRGSRRKDNLPDKDDAPKPGLGGKLFDMLAKMQARAEELRNEQGKDKDKGKGK